MKNYSKADEKLMEKASFLCDNASCGYKVGCVIVKDGTILVESWNKRLPGNEFCNYGTCIREEENLTGGKHIDRVCSIHAEQAAIAQAGAKGISLQNSTMYVTTYPCLICAKSIAVAGVKKIFFMTAYMGENFAASILKAHEIEVIQIPMEIFWK